jgi:hypothetical protein
MRRILISAFALAAGLAVVMASFAVAEKPTVVRAGNLILKINGGVTPRKLPRHRLAPITLNASGAIGTTDGSQPPALKEVTIDFDKHGTVNAKGLAVCQPGKLQATDTKRAKQACRGAIVGHGSTRVKVAFPEQAPFESSGPLVLFNGGVRGGVTTMYIHAYVNVPAPTAIVTRVKIKKIHKGRYGTRAVASIPVIAGGSGSVTHFSLAVHRLFKRHGKMQSYLLAECANGHFFAHATAKYRDGRTLTGDVVRACTPKG